MSDAGRTTRRGRGHRSSVDGSTRRQDYTDQSRATHVDVTPVDFDEVRSRLDAEQYSSIVCTALPLVISVSDIENMFSL